MIKFTDERLPKQSNNHNGLSNGTLLMAMIINALGFSAKPMYLYSDFFIGIDTKVLFGDDFDISKVNDDALGRMLDTVYEYGVEKFYLEFGRQALTKMGFNPEYLHLDSTSFHLHGEKYNEDKEVTKITISGKSETPKNKGIKIVQGYSRDAHPELPQVMMQMIVDNKAGIPLFMKPQDGNTNDSKGFAESLDVVESMLSSLQKGTNAKYLVCDAALYTKKNLENIYKTRENRIKFITRAPAKIKEVEEQIKRANEEGFEKIRDQYSGRIYDFKYGDVPQKILIVKSEQAMERVKKTIDKRADKELKALEDEFKKLARKQFNCEKDAKMEYDEIVKKYTNYAIPDGEAIIKQENKFSKPGRKKADAQPDATIYRINGKAKLDATSIERDKDEQGCFVIATNDIERDWTMQDLLDGYKSQQRVERGFRFLKDPEFFADSIFLKTPQRIEALLMVMVTTLFVYSSTEYMLRKNLEEKKMTVANQLGKQINNPTLRWILSKFNMQCIGRFFTNDNLVGCTDLTKDQSTVIRALGNEWLEIYKHFV